MRGRSHPTLLAAGAALALALAICPVAAQARTVPQPDPEVHVLSATRDAPEEREETKSDLLTWSKGSDGTYRATRADGTTAMTVAGATGLGVDVSQWQGEIDWAAVKRSGIVNFAILRCGWGDAPTGQDDTRFIENVRGCVENGIPFGIYLYSYAVDESAAQAEADHALRLLSEAGLSPSKLAYPVFLDLENQRDGKPAGLDTKGVWHTLTNDQLAKIANAFCTRVKQAGYRPGIYSNLNWWSNFLLGDSYDGWARWVAQYNTSCSYTGGYDIWQCSSRGSIAGIGTAVDVNLSFDRASTLPASDPDETACDMYRLYNRWTGEHLYTKSAGERDALAQVGWTYEGVAWNAPTKTGKPVYRLYNPYVSGGDHHYTMDENEYARLKELGWKQEGVAWLSAPKEGGVALYRLYNPYAATGTHHYTADAHERDVLKQQGWHDEGTAWYGLASS